ncbi:hypothetical protein QBC34DRAFT_409310 [Podospora aff. communis PSN243]|uniref:Centromere protein H C-terminal domain-containing protein n=1 Tax=Podospora aff. communis PSN243 TaxID=3040156 RepID=A0AAV9GM16_9PEZI|nr:hypothetical protein QBC34DRAFT_409310 [Podospora aff. communis PSN243]
MEGVSNLPSEVHKGDVDRTLRELDNAIKDIEEALKEVRATPSRVPDSELKAEDSMEIMIKAYKDATESEPFLPSRGSMLPALLAMRKVQKTTEQTKAHTLSQQGVLSQTKKRVDEEQVNLREQRALQAALEKRIQSLRDGLETREEKTSEQLAREKIAALKKQKAVFNRQTLAVMKDLDWFIENHLGAMLAAEELGGPVVGEMTEIDPEELTAGFNAHGKPKKVKSNPNEDRRQRRIDEIWGGASEEQGARGKRKREGDEASAASAEMRDLTEQLLNQAMESGGDSSAAYIRIPRESAAVRSLVRSKVAEFHPKDANRLRLIDFGRELDD